ncbi:MAG: hypothetical protein ABI619_14125 [Betaproteobacteria bacterium]
MAIRIEAVVPSSEVRKIANTLTEMEIPGITANDVWAGNAHPGGKRTFGGLSNLLSGLFGIETAKTAVKFDIVIPSAMYDTRGEAITALLVSQSIDSVVAVSKVENVICIQTGQVGDKAL